MSIKGVPKVGLIPWGDPKRGSLKGDPKGGPQGRSDPKE